MAKNLFVGSYLKDRNCGGPAITSRSDCRNPAALLGERRKLRNSKILFKIQITHSQFPPEERSLSGPQ